MYRLIVVVLVVVAVSCASSEPVALPPELPTPTALPAPTAQRPLSPAPTASPAPTPTTFPSAMLQQATRDEALEWLGYAGYSPFNVDGQTGVGPWMFGGTPEDQNEAMTCYRRELDRLVDVAAVADRFAVTDDRQLLDEENRGARQAVANCMTAEALRTYWLEQQVAGWNIYGRSSDQPELALDDPCLSPVFDSPDDFVAAVVSDPFFSTGGKDFIGPFDCTASVRPEREPLPAFGHPWYQCEVDEHPVSTFEYLVINIEPDDPDGGLVTHVGPGVDAEVLEVLAGGLGGLNVIGCQRNADSGNVWWLVSDRGWVNAFYLRAHVAGGAPDWQPGVGNPIETDRFAALVGIEADNLEALEIVVREQLGGPNVASMQLGDFQGADAQGGTVAFDITGLRDDSIAGYRIELNVELIKDTDASEIIGVRVVDATGRVICSRGVSDDLCI